MRKYGCFLLPGLPFLLAASAVAAHPTALTPLVDGDCSEYSQLPAQRIDAGSGVVLHIYQDEHYVWLCYSYPPGSDGQFDMKLKTEKLPNPLNLHVSAKLGEWPVDREDLQPKNPESDLWWNQKDWIGTTSMSRGMDVSGPKPVSRLKYPPGRELQIAKKRFGHGEWQFALTIYRVKSPDGKLFDLQFPADGSYYTLMTN